MNVYAMDKLMTEARKLAAQYREATGKPLAISTEIARHDACRLLNLNPVESADAGYDAVGTGPREALRIQIKGRAIFNEGKSGQRIGQLKLEQPWDRVVLVIMDAQFEPVEIYEASREEVEQAIDQDSRRNKRGALSVARFRNISQLVWRTDEGPLEDDVWDNQSG